MAHCGWTPNQNLLQFATFRLQRKIIADFPQRAKHKTVPRNNIQQEESDLWEINSREICFRGILFFKMNSVLYIWIQMLLPGLTFHASKKRKNMVPENYIYPKRSGLGKLARSQCGCQWGAKRRRRLSVGEALQQNGLPQWQVKTTQIISLRV